MAQHVIGPDNFQKGIQYFLPIYNGSNIEPIYVWNKLEVFILRELLPKTENLNGAMNNWSENAGYPLVTVTARGSDIVLTQERFLYSEEEDFTEWCVPITYTLSEDMDKFQNTTTKAWLLPKTSQTIYNILNESEWIIVNNQQVGYYRVNYDTTLWQKINKVLLTNHTSIHVLNRAQIVDDLLNLARAKIVNYSFAFDMIRYLKQENESYPWQSAINNFNYLLIQLGEDSVLGTAVSSMILELLENVSKSVSFDDGDPDDQVYILKRLTILNTACKLADESCISNSKDLFAKYKTGISIEKNLREIVYCNALRYSDDIVSDWNFLWEIFQSESLTSEREIMITALGCAKDDAILKHYLDQSMNSSSGLSLDDLPKIWKALYTSGPEGIDAAFDYLCDNYDKVSEYYSSASNLLVSVVERFTRSDQLEKLEDLSSGILDSSVRAIAQSALQAAKEKLEWVESIEYDLSTYFNIPGSDTTTQVTITTTGGSDIIEMSFIRLIVIVVFKYLILF